MFAVIYHYWKDNRDATPCYQDLANPVVVSIATLRFHHPTVPVYVIDISDRPGDWGPFPNILRFKVIRQAPSLPLYYKGTHDHRDQSLNISYNTFKYCSSTFDVTGLADKITQDTILFSDSDIFYLKHLNPLPKDRFCCRSGFVGYYYYNKTVLKVRKFIELWKTCILKGITDLSYRSVLTAGYRVPGFMNQETAYIHLCKTVEVKDTILDLLPYEHCFEIDYPPDELGFFHFTGFHFGKRRGLAAFVILEYYSMLRAVLGDHGIYLIFNIDPTAGGFVPFVRRDIIAGCRLDRMLQ